MGSQRRRFVHHTSQVILGGMPTERRGDIHIMRIRGTPIGILVGALFTCMAVLGVFYGIALSHRDRARAFLNRFSSLKLGESTFADAQQLARDYGGVTWDVSTENVKCTFQKCAFAFKFENVPLNYIPYIHHTEFVADIVVKDGIIVGRQLEYEHNSRSNYYFRYVIFDDMHHVDKPHDWYGTWRLGVDDRGIAHEVQIRLGSASTEALRNRAYSISLSCLARLYDCRAPSAFYPSGTPYAGTPSQGQVPDEQ